jgi:hypothetical protein
MASEATITVILGVALNGQIINGLVRYVKESDSPHLPQTFIQLDKQYSFQLFSALRWLTCKGAGTWNFPHGCQTCRHIPYCLSDSKEEPIWKCLPKQERFGGGTSYQYNDIQIILDSSNASPKASLNATFLAMTVLR